MEKKRRKRYEKDNFWYAACSLHDDGRNAANGICGRGVDDVLRHLWQMARRDNYL